jgi:hypothetical protein
MKISVENLKGIEQHKELYDSAIIRQGQYVRWKSGIPCYCIGERGIADPACKKCFGRGFILYPIEYVTRKETGYSKGGSVITTTGKIYSINKIIVDDNTLSYQDFNGSRIVLRSSLIPGKEYIVEYKQDLRNSFTGQGICEERGIIRVNIPPISSEEGEFLGEIIKVEYARNNTRGNEMNVLDIWDNMILTDSNMTEDDDIEVKCTYLLPFKFLLQGLTMKQKHERMLLNQTGEMQITIPGEYIMGSSDTITLLKPVQRMSIVGKLNEPYRLPVFKAREILRIEDDLGLIEDAKIIRNNEILWNSRKPHGNFSLSFTYSPTYRVDDDIPNLRYSEDKILPKKLTLKKWDVEERANIRPQMAMVSSQQNIY